MTGLWVKQRCRTDLNPRILKNSAPYAKITLSLSHVTGLHIDAWVKVQI